MIREKIEFRPETCRHRCPSEIPLTHPIRIDRLRARLAARPFPSCRVPRRFLSVTSPDKDGLRERTVKEDERSSVRVCMCMCVCVMRERERERKRLVISSVRKKERKRSVQLLAAINPISQPGVLISAPVCSLVSRARLPFHPADPLTRRADAENRETARSIMANIEREREREKIPGPFLGGKGEESRFVLLQKGSKRSRRRWLSERERKGGGPRRQMKTKGTRGEAGRRGPRGTGANP